MLVINVVLVSSMEYGMHHLFNLNVLMMIK